MPRACEIDLAVYDVSGRRVATLLGEVLPAGEQTLVKFIAVTDRVLANLAFGSEAFGATTLYLTRLAIPPFSAASTRSRRCRARSGWRRGL